MANDRQLNLSVLIGVVDNASATLQKFQKEIDMNKKAIDGTAIALSAMGAAGVAAFTLAVKAAGEQELAFARLQRSLENTNNSWSDNEDSINGFIDGMMQSSTIGEEELAGTLQILLRYTDDLSVAMQGATLAQEISAAGMKDVAQAAKLVGMAQNGNIEMLGRYIPELKLANDETLKYMTQNERAAYALEILRQKFGGMSAVELNTFPGQIKQLSNYTGELVEDIGEQLLPILKSLSADLLSVINTIRNWIAEHPILVSIIVQTAAALSAYSMGVGGLMLALPQLIEKTIALNKVLAANPYILVAAGIAGVTAAVYAFFDARQKEIDQNTNLMKTHQDRLKGFEEERDLIILLRAERQAATTGYAAEQRRTTELTKEHAGLRLMTNEELAVRLKALEFNIAQETTAIQQQKNAALNMTDAERLAQAQVFYETEKAYLDDYDNYLSAKIEKMKYKFSSAWRVAFADSILYEINWYNHITSTLDGVQSAMSSGFSNIFAHIHEGWDNLKGYAQKMAEGMRDAIISSLAQIAAEWIIKHALMTAATQAWRVIEVGAAAAVAAAKAAAATAWTLWGAIAIGAAIGWGVISMARGFQEGGVVPGNSTSGDRMVARVNSGEMILNPAQQARLFEIANGSGGGAGIAVYVSGNYILDDRTAQSLADRVGEALMIQIRNGRNV